MAATRDTGIEPLGHMPWGLHICLFYESKQDALDTVIPFFKAGLEGGERCIWAVSEPLDEENAIAALIEAIPGAAQKLADGVIEILPGDEWYLDGGNAAMLRIVSGWETKLASALAQGYEGLRISGNAFWLQAGQWEAFTEYEQGLSLALAGQQMLCLCTYSLQRTGAAEVLDVARAHEFTLARRHGEWEIVETPELKQAKREIIELKTRLELRVSERTQELAAANERLEAEFAERERVEAALEEAKAGLARTARLTTMGELAASIAHEINQPLTGIVTNGEASLRWLTNKDPGVEEAKAGLKRIVRDANRAADVIKRIRALVDGKAEHAEFDINEAIGEAVVLMRSTLQSYRVGTRLAFASVLPRAIGDKLQVQQAVTNLVINAAEAMADAEGSREIVIESGLDPGGRLLVSVEDHGSGIRPQAIDRMFEPFFTTKSGGMGLGLSIARSIIEAHGGSLSAAPAAQGGTVFQFTIPGASP
jgi:C4-dicarboxylate-specific signal transduction histidine kinase